ncbi:MAG: hypothetical protein ABMA64_23270 [Myxococcota bacterium]
MNMRALGPVVLAGCLSTPLQRVETLGAGQYEVAVEGGVSTLDQRVLPTANVAVRYGGSDRVDLGLRVGTQLYEVQAKFLLSSLEADFPVSLAPSFTAISGRDPFGGPEQVTVVFTSFPVLIGVPLAGGHQLVVAPGINPTFGGVGIDDAAVLIEPRLSVGLSARLSPVVRLHPELAASVDAFSVGADGLQGSAGLVRFAGALSFAFGNGYREPPAR